MDQFLGGGSLRRGGYFGPGRVAHSVDANGGGAWELAARYSHTDATDAGITGGVMDISSLGLNWWLSTSFVTSVNYRWIDHEIGGVQGHTQGLVGRIMLVLE